MHLGKALDLYNFKYRKNIQLHIYTSTILNSKSINILKNINSTLILKAIKKDELYRLYNIYSYLIHVESFKNKYINKTLYSISTKIPEYLNSSANIIAIGNSKIASISLIKDYAYIISNKKRIEISITNILNNNVFINHNRDILLNNIYNYKKNLLDYIKRLLDN
jgi:hypothetical protein